MYSEIFSLKITLFKSFLVILKINIIIMLAIATLPIITYYILVFKNKLAFSGYNKKFSVILLKILVLTILDSIK